LPLQESLSFFFQVNERQIAYGCLFSACLYTISHARK